MENGGAIPAWCGVLLAAQDWGTPPWEIAGGSKMVWYWRWQYYTNAVEAKKRRDYDAMAQRRL